MSDDFIGSLKADWDGAGAEAELIRLRRRRWTPHAWLAADALGAATMIVFGFIYAALAVRYRDLLFALSAIAMLPVGLPLATTAVVTRWRALAWEGETAEGVLRSSLRRLEATRKALRLGRVGAIVLLATAVIVWAGALVDLVREPRGVLAIITGTWVLAGVSGLGWNRWRLARVGREIAGCETLLRQFEMSAGDESE
jgi:hypothetical protein